MSLIGTRSAVGQTVVWTGGSGTWSDAAGWSLGVAPNGTTYDVAIDNNATLSSAVSISPGLSYKTRTLTIGGNDSLALYQAGLSAATLNNAGTLVVDSGSTLTLRVNNATGFGNGTLMMGGGYLYAGSSTNAGTIRGSGNVSNLIANSGTIVATSLDTALSIEAGSFTNNGTLSSSNTGTMLSTAATLYCNTAGSFTNNGTIITNGGSISIGSDHFVNSANGKVILNGGAIYIPDYTLTRDDDFDFRKGIFSFGSMTTAGHTIADGGAIGGFYKLNNNNGTLIVTGDTRLGTMSNVGGQILINGGSAQDFYSYDCDNTGGTINATNNGVLTLYYGGKVHGGVFNSSTGGYMSLTGSGTYGSGYAYDLTNNGTINLFEYAAIGGTIGGSGTIVFQGQPHQYLMPGTVRLSGTGAALLQDGTIDALGGDVKFINDVGHTLSGQGTFCLSPTGTSTRSIENRGLIVSGGSNYSTSLRIGGEHLLNTSTGTLRTIGNGLLYFQTDDFVSEGTIEMTGKSVTIVPATAGGGVAKIASVTGAGVLYVNSASATINSAVNASLTLTGQATIDQMDVNAINSTGVLTLASGQAKTAAKLKTFAINTMDLTDRGLLVDWTGTSALTRLTQKLKVGAASTNGAWAATTNAFYSTVAATDPMHHAIGIAELSTIFGSAVPTTFLDQSVDATTVALRYTYLGDTNLDGKVDIVDLGSLANHYQQAGLWTGGDFNYDGKIDIVDLGMLAGSWHAGTSGNAMTFAQAALSVGLGGASVPEPSTIALLAMPIALLRRRQRATYCCS